MELEKIIEELGLRDFNAGMVSGVKVSGAYVSDLLSDVMGGASEGELWITLQAHGNVVAIASLRELSAIILVNGIVPDEAVVEKAREEEIPLLGTTESTFETGGRLYRLLNK